MARIKQCYHNVELVPEGTTQRRYIYDNGEYPVVDTSADGKEVFEGGFDDNYYYDIIVSPEWLAEHPYNRYHYTLRRFKLLN